MDYLVQAGVEVQDLQAVYISNHQPVLNTRSLQTGRTQTRNQLNQSIERDEKCDSVLFRT